MAVLVGEVQEQVGGRWRTVQLGAAVRVDDRRKVAHDLRIASMFRIAQPAHLFTASLA